MKIPENLGTAVQKLLDKPVRSATSVSGGSINQAAKITAEDDTIFFLKWNTAAPHDMFPKEEKGLETLRSAQSELHVPKVVGTGSTPEGTRFLAMDFIESGSEKTQSAAQFGRHLASMHKVAADQYGLNYDNYIGRLPQSNTQHDNWIDFFVQERLQPQLEQALESGKLPTGINKKFQHLYKRLPELLPKEPPALLHGDLWGGNYFYDKTGGAVLYDPAVYYGNREIELAFTHLFGGFSTAFYQAYQETHPLQPGFNERIDMYNLYPLLVHTNLFGGSYARQVKNNVKQFA